MKIYALNTRSIAVNVKVHSLLCLFWSCFRCRPESFQMLSSSGRNSFAQMRLSLRISSVLSCQTFNTFGSTIGTSSFTGISFVLIPGWKVLISIGFIG